MNSQITYLTHYTNKAGYDAIMAKYDPKNPAPNQVVLRASVLEGKQHTHYGKGVYFSPIGATEIFLFGIKEFVTRLFNSDSEAAALKCTYHITVKVDKSWYPIMAVASDEKFKPQIKDIWLVPQTDDLDITAHIDSHGETVVLDQLRKGLYKPSGVSAEGFAQLMASLRPSQLVSRDGTTVDAEVDWSKLVPLFDDI
ncbi:hypothetical protein QBC47DRAFT_408237 [Echria macrotheca]|uniref:Uncharacterized protein n=1 Tax=Echria macrotheca TaxID=438768 RepID=A0AAJ0BKV6_9PEZI|nr:hypothetical protein QBC47DRAFT_408237 [Echria macrotheca]